MRDGTASGRIGNRPDRPRLLPRADLTLLIAWRAFVHDRVRMAVTIAGIGFSTVLMGIQLGLLLNFLHTTSMLVDHSGADLWLVAHGVRAVDLATPLQERRRYQALEVPGVARAEPYFMQFGTWKRHDGVRESVVVVGTKRDATMGMPWAMLPGESARDAVAVPDGVVTDRLYLDRLGISGLDQRFEIDDRRVRVTGLTQGIRTFTQSPYVFTSLRDARRIAGAAADAITYVLIRLAPGYRADVVARELAARMPDIDVLTTAAFAGRSRAYWLLTTGAGVSVVSSSLLALMVGIAIAAQTLYASTVDRLPEYATIRAMGGPRSYLYRIVMKQAVIGGLPGYAGGIALVAALAWFGRNGSAPPEMPIWLGAVIGLTTVLMCVTASLVSLKRVMAIDPAAVFR